MTVRSKSFPWSPRTPIINSAIRFDAFPSVRPPRMSPRRRLLHSSRRTVSARTRAKFCVRGTQRCGRPHRRRCRTPPFPSAAFRPTRFKPTTSPSRTDTGIPCSTIDRRPWIGSIMPMLMQLPRYFRLERKGNWRPWKRWECPNRRPSVALDALSMRYVLNSIV
jgi:hypothetical protein